MIRIIEGFRAQGEVDAVGSKSDAHRALICASLCSGSTAIGIERSGVDIDTTAQCLRSMGAKVERTASGFTVTGKAEGGGSLYCCESGSTLRFLLPVAAALGGETLFTGSGKLPSRPMLPLTELLREKGATVSSDLLPIKVNGRIRGGVYEISGSVSSQFISGLLMALPLTREQCEIKLISPLQSAQYVDMTVDTLKRFGVVWERTGSGYKLLCGEYKSAECYTVDGDWSGAAFFLALGALGGDVTVKGLLADSIQPDRAIVDAVRRFGAEAVYSEKGINVKGSRCRAFEADVCQYPDLFPVLAVLACGAKGKSVLYNAGRLRIKESDRIATTAAMINALGGRAEQSEDSLTVYGSGSLKGGKVDGAGDHRIVMSAAVAAAICEDAVIIEGAQAVEKSYPSFFEALEKITEQRHK